MIGSRNFSASSRQAESSFGGVMTFAALGDLSGSQSFGIVTDHFSGQILFMENCRVEASSRTAINNRIVKAMSDEPP